MELLIIVVFMGVGAIIFVAGALKMFSGFTKQIQAVGGLEGLKAAHLQMTEEHPARVLPTTTPTGKVESTRLVLSIMAFFVLLSFGLGAFFQSRAIRAARLLESEGVVVTANVTARSISEDDDGDETYYVSYTFVAPSGEAIKRKESVPYRMFAQVEEGGQIDAIYARSDPKVARLMANYTPGRVSYLPAIIGGIVGLVALLLALAFSRAYRNAVRLDAEGFSTWVQVLDLFESSDSDSTTYYVAYTLPDEQKIRHAVEPAIYRRLHVGDQIRVVYLPDNPKVFRPEWG